MADAYPGPIADLEPQSLPPEMKKEGPDWFAVFNPNAAKETKKKLDVNLVHTLSHERCVGAFETETLELTCCCKKRGLLCAVLCRRQVPCYRV